MENELKVIEEVVENVTEEVVTTSSKKGLKNIGIGLGIYVGVKVADKFIINPFINKVVKPAIIKIKSKKSKGTLAIDESKPEETEDVTVE